MKRIFALLFLTACLGQPKKLDGYDGYEAPLPRTSKIVIHNLSSSNSTVYIIRPSNGNRYRLETVTSQDITRAIELDSEGCIQTYVHQIGDAFNKNDWTSPRTCWLRGSQFDLTLGIYPQSNNLAVSVETK